LPAAARTLLDVAAVLDAAADLAVLRAAAGSTADHLDRCVEAGMLVVTDGTPGFRHELARLAVFAAIPPGRRAELHGIVLRVLEAAGATAASLAHHAEEAGDRAATRRYAEQAARHAARLGAHRQAAAQYARALRALPADADAERAELLVRCSHECALCDRIAEATAEAEQALAVWRALGDRLREGDTLSWLSRLAWMSQRVGDAERLGRTAVGLLERLPPGIELARAQATLAQQLATLFAHQEAQEWGHQALRLAQRLGADEIAAQASIDLGLARALSGDLAGTAQMEHGIDMAMAAHSDDHAARGLFQLVRVAHNWLHHAELDERAAAAKAFCTERGVEFWGDYARAFQAHNHMLRGQWDPAAAQAAQLWRRTTPASPAARTIALALTLGQIRLRRGENDPDRLLDAAAARGAPVPSSAAALGVAAARAEAAWLAGRLADVVDELRAGWAHAQSLSDGWWNAELRWWLQVAGCPEADGDITGFAGRVAGGWKAAAAGFLSLGLPYHRALALAESQQESPLRDALAIAHDLGAVPLGRLVSRRLRALGARDIPRPLRPDRVGSGPLTPREHEVLVLLAEGLRDAEIATRLHLSERTVNHHVSAVLRKLSVPSRTAALALARRDGILRSAER
jgi:DNA-binding CsgD family transcriptional regulator